MKLRANAAFTLMEMLVSALVLTFIVVLAAQMTSGVISTVSHSSHQLDASESVRGAVQTLREELGGAIASDRPGRFLNMKLTQDEKGASLYLTIPRAQTSELTRMGFVEHVAYVWDKESRTLTRASYHSSRDPEAVRATAKSTSGVDEVANVDRLRAITPAYQGVAPYDWIALPMWEERIAQARRNPLLVKLADWKVECFETADLEQEEPAINAWEHPDRMPVAMRFTFVIDAQKRTSSGGETTGRRFTSLIALPGARPQP